MTQRTHLKLLIAFIGFISIFFSTNIWASKQITLDTVQHTAERHVEQLINVPERGKLKLTAASLDSRLRLSECSEPLNSTIPGKQSLTGNVTVLISCSPENWQVYVPVRVKLLLPRVVAATPLARGLVLNASHLSVKLIESRFQRGIVFEQPAEIIGSKVKRTIKMGEAVQGNDICLVCRNDAVMIKAGNSGLNIITNGTALSDGALGEQIRVQNTKSKRIIDGIVSAVGEVTVNY